MIRLLMATICLLPCTLSGADLEALLSQLEKVRPAPNLANTISTLTESLGGDTYKTRHDAEAKLVAIGIRCEPHLKTLVTTKDPEVRHRIKRILNRLQATNENARWFQLLSTISSINSFPDQSSATRILDLIPSFATKSLQRRAALTAKHATLKAKTRDSQHFIPLLENDHPNTVTAAIACYQVIGSSTPNPIRDLLSDENSTIRLAAAECLAHWNQREALGALIDLLEDEKTPIRSRAISLLYAWTGEKYDFHPDATYRKQRISTDRWKQWLTNEASEASLNHPLILKAQLNPITGLLLSVHGEKVIMVDLQGQTSWSHKCEPYDAQLIDGLILITERDEGKVSLINQEKQEIRTIKNLASPTDSELLPNGNILILENNAGRVQEFDQENQCVWKVDGLTNPYDVDRLDNGNTLVADSGADRVVEFDPAGKIIWEKHDLPFPNGVLRLEDGSTIYTTYTSGGVGILDPDGKEVWYKVFEGTTTYPPAIDDEFIYVPDGKKGNIMVLDRNGKSVRNIHLPGAFIDAWFIR